MKYVFYIFSLCCGILNIQAQSEHVDDYRKMRDRIIEKYSIYLRKSQFESKNDYELRIKNEDNAGFNKIVDTTIDESKNKALEPFFLYFSGLNSNTILKYDAESEVFFLLDDIQIPISKKVAEEFYDRLINRRPDKWHKVLIVPQEVLMIEDNWHYSSVLLLFDLYERTKITPQLGFYSFDGPLDCIDVKRVDTKNKNCYIKATQYGFVRLPIHNLKILKDTSASSIQEHIYFYEWVNESIDPIDIQSLDDLYDKVLMVMVADNYDISKKYVQNKGQINNQMVGLFGNGTSEGTQGVPTGNASYGKTSGVGGWASFDLGGRSIGSRGLIKPNYSVDDSGTVVVDILVNAKGDVVEATIGKGTNTPNTNLRNEALRAAKRTKFNAVSAVINQKGTITYKFNLN